MFGHGSTKFQGIFAYITVDETWMHHYTLETNKQAKQWVEAGSSASNQEKLIHWAGKFMVTVFWDQGIILIDYIEKEKNYNSRILYRATGLTGR